VTEELIDSYEVNDADVTFKDHHPSDSVAYSAGSQSFSTASIDGPYKITKAQFCLKKSGSPTGNAHATLYDYTGTYDTSARPIGYPLATSDAFDVSTLDGVFDWYDFDFSTTQRFILEPDRYYCIVYENPATGTISPTDYVISRKEAALATHSGVWAVYKDGAWEGWTNGHDGIFRVYGEKVLTLSGWWSNIIDGVRSGDPSTSLNVTWHKLALGDADATTGWFAETYTESTIQMIIYDTTASLVNLPVAVAIRSDAVGATNNFWVREGDRIQSFSNDFYEVKATRNRWKGYRFMFKECDLQHLKLYKK
jgi:hypothetical protein